MGHFRSGANGEGRAPELFFFGTLYGENGFSNSTMPVRTASGRNR